MVTPSAELSKVGERTLTAALNYLVATADFIETTADTEESTNTKIQDFGKLWGSKEFITNLQEKLGAEKVNDVASLLLRIVVLLSTNIYDAQPKEKRRIAVELRKTAGEVEKFLALVNS